MVTCYLRHLKPILDKTEIEVTKENKKKIDRTIHDLVGVEYKDCAATWKELKRRLLEDKEGFVERLKRVLAEDV